MPKKRAKNCNLGSSPLYHAKGARAAYQDAMNLFDRAIKASAAGSCASAYDKLTVASHDYGRFFNEFKHAVGVRNLVARGVMGAPRMRQLLVAKRSTARAAFAERCLVK